VQGVDVWLNTPRPPLEASGTSGMKAGLNGVPSASILDGWWVEGYDGGNGWAFGPPAGSDEVDEPDPAAADARDAESLYRVLEETIVPLYYDRDAEGVPHGWLRVVRRAMQTLTPAFSARRMMKEYVERMYLPAVTAAEEEPGALPRR
jgi:glycogen phosphorylase